LTPSSPTFDAEIPTPGDGVEQTQVDVAGDYGFGAL
jgi:hypothetical protein